MKSTCRDRLATDSIIKSGQKDTEASICATGVLNLPPCSGVENPKSIHCSGTRSIVLYCIVFIVLYLYCIVFVFVLYLYCIVLHCIVLYCIVLYCIVLYCIVLETKIIFMLYLFNQMILPYHFSSTMFVQNSFKFSITAITLSYDIRSSFQN